MEHTGIKQLARYLQVYCLFLKINFLRAWEYRANFVISLVATSAYMLGYLAYLRGLTSQSSINGWDFNQMLILFSVSQFVVYLSWALFRVSVKNLPRLVKEGSLDGILRLPIASRFVVSIHDHGTDWPLPFAVALGTFIYATRGFAWDPARVLTFLILLVSGLVIFYNILFVLASLAFWIVESEDIASLMEEVVAYSRYPLSVFPTVVSVIFLLIVPVLLMAYVPATVVTGAFDPRLGVLSLTMVVVTFVLSQAVWRLGLKEYSGASS